MTSANPIVKLSRQKRLRVAGLMSGTSADGVDVAIVDIDSRSRKVVAFGMVRYPAALRKTVFELFDPATSHVDTICEANFVLGSFFAKALIKVCQKNNIFLETIDLIGSHGQTIYHNPQRKRNGSTLQIGEPSVIAKQTGITTFADFRPCDMACGGEGAPLVPFADHILFRHRTKNRVIQNIGGIANLTYLPANGTISDIIAFDTGPGNMIIDGVV
jgi:anhydro-N-acetylmuramic acid kinase